MKSTHELLQMVRHMRVALSESMPNLDDGSAVDSVPTLDPSVRRPVSPMLYERFLFCGGWGLATHGDWLGIDEMTLVANNDLSNDRIAGIVGYKDAAALDWPNDACGLFRQDRLSLFAGSDVTYTRVYIIWLDEVIEPEVWAYDSNGEARYQNLNDYLQAVLNDDLSAYEKKWHLADL